MRNSIKVFSFMVLLLLMMESANAKDYFGLNLSTETIDSATKKANSLFADNQCLDNAGLRIYGNGLLRFYGWFDYMDVKFRTGTGINQVDVFANNLSDAQLAKLIKHLHEDYDLADLSALPYRGKDIRGIVWDARLVGKSALISLTNETSR